MDPAEGSGTAQLLEHLSRDRMSPRAKNAGHRMASWKKRPQPVTLTEGEISAGATFNPNDT